MREQKPVAPYLLLWLANQPGRKWQGTTGQLWQKLMDQHSNSPPASFPRAPQALGKFIKRIEPALSARGIEIERDHGRSGTVLQLAMM